MIYIIVFLALLGFTFFIGYCYLKDITLLWIAIAIFGLGFLALIHLLKFPFYYEISNGF